MLTNLPPIRDQFGQYYRICSPMDAPATIQPRDCLDEFMTRQFLHSVDAPFGLWGNLLHRYDLSGSGLTGQGDSEEQAIARLLAAGRLVIYPVADPAKAAAYSRRATFSKSASAQWRVAAPDAQNTRGQKKHFRSKTEALTFLTALNPGAEQLHAMQQMADASRTSPATIDRVAADLASNKLVVIEEPVQAAATAAQSEQTSETDEPQSANLAQEPGLGPESITPMPAANDEKEADEEPVCAFTKLSLRCDHYSKRGYILDCVSAEPNLNGVAHVIEVISQKRDPDYINPSFAGTCVQGNNECPGITISGDGISETITASPHKFPVVAAEPTRGVNSFTDFLRHYMVPNKERLDFQTYTIKAHGCADIEQHEAKIHVFPTYKWEGGVKMGYCYQGDFDNNKACTDEPAKWSLEAKLKGNCGAQSWTLETGNGEETDDYFPSLYNMLRKFADRIDDMIVAKKEKDSSPIKVDLTWPKIELSGDIELQEVETSHQVELGGSVSLNMSPLIEADMTLDIVHWLIKCAPPGYSQLLEEIRQRAAEGIGTNHLNANAVVALDLTITGGLGGKLAWKRPANKPWRGDATGKAALSFKLKAEVSADATIF